MIQLLVDLDLLPHDRVRLLYSWKHSGFNVHHGEGIPPENKAVTEQLAQYILRNPFSVAKMRLNSLGKRVIYRSKLNLKINRNFEIFTGPEMTRVCFRLHFGNSRARCGCIIAARAKCRLVIVKFTQP